MISMRRFFNTIVSFLFRPFVHENVMKVKFRFGPYDGHTQNAKPEQLNELVALPVSCNYILAMTRRNIIPTVQANKQTSIAYYELIKENDWHVYYYLGSISPETLEKSEEQCRGK